MTGPILRRRAAGCLSDLELDELNAGDLAGDGRERRVRDHLAGCADCRVGWAFRGGGGAAAWHRRARAAPGGLGARALARVWRRSCWSPARRRRWPP